MWVVHRGLVDILGAFFFLLFHKQSLLSNPVTLKSDCSIVNLFNELINLLTNEGCIKISGEAGLVEYKFA